MKLVERNLSRTSDSEFSSARDLSWDAVVDATSEAAWDLMGDLYYAGHPSWPNDPVMWVREEVDLNVWDDHNN